MLKLTMQAESTAFIVAEIVGGIADVHPQLVLSYLSDQAGHAGGAAIELDTELDARTLAEWIRNNLDAASSSAVVAAAVKDQLSADQAEALLPVVTELDAARLEGFVHALGELDIWPLDHPRLAEAVIRRARRQTRRTGFEAS